VTISVSDPQVAQSPYFPRNPFTDEYAHGELAFYGTQHPERTVGRVHFSYHQLRGVVVDDYLNKCSRVRVPPTPRLTIGDQVWMSLSYMECQSAAPLIALSQGVVGQSGLGYTALRCAAKPEVTCVEVAERDRDAIALFEQMHGQRPECAKITILRGDALRLLAHRPYDVLFLDHYQKMLPDQLLRDLSTITGWRSARTILFWGLEAVVVDALKSGDIHTLLPWEREYLDHWERTPVPGLRGVTLASLYRPHTDHHYRKSVLRALGRL
jgi:hypothetical protein